MSEGTRQERYCCHCKGNQSRSTPSDLSLHLVLPFHLLLFYRLINDIYHSKYLHGIVFWDTRIAASHLTHSQTRLPDVPDQTRFLNQWYDWHPSYTMAENEDGLQHSRNVRSESISDIAPGQLLRNQYDQATIVADDQDELLGHPITPTQSWPDSPPLDELPIDSGDRLFNSASQSPQLSTMESQLGDDGRYITEEDSMPPSLREARPFLHSFNSLRTAAEAPNMLRDLRAVLADTSQTETETIMAEQEARVRLHDATMEVEQAAERLDVTRRVSQNTQRRIQRFENAARVIGNREQVDSQGDDYMNSRAASLDRLERRRRAAQTAAAEASAMSSTTQAARSHSHPSRRDESRTDQSSPSGSPSNIFTTAYVGPLNPRASELFPSALDPRDYIYPSNDRTSHSRHVDAQTSSTRSPPVFANLTNVVGRSGSRAPRHQLSSDDRSFLERQQPSESRIENSRGAIHIHWRPQDPLEGRERDLMRLLTTDASRRPAPVSRPISIEEASRRLPDASSSRFTRTEANNRRLAEIRQRIESNRMSPIGSELASARRLIESNMWNPPSSDLESSFEYANANPFSPSSSSNQQSNPLMAGARALYSTDRSMTNTLGDPAIQRVISVKPPPRTKAEMTVDLECRICMEQPATVACLPCGKLNES